MRAACTLNLGNTRLRFLNHPTNPFTNVSNQRNSGALTRRASKIDQSSLVAKSDIVLLVCRGRVLLNCSGRRPGGISRRDGDHYKPIGEVAGTATATVSGS